MPFQRFKAEAPLLLLIWLCSVGYALMVAPFPFHATPHEIKYGVLSDDELIMAKEQVREMFYFGYTNYMNNAFPLDELDPIHCCGRGPDYANPSNININDALGNYSLTLIDSLTTLVVLGDKEEFHRAVRLVIDNVSFSNNVTVQVFEATIRVMGGLLSAHLILTNANPYYGNFTLPNYNGELLTMAHDIATRLLPAFKGTKTGLPYPRVNLLNGVLPFTINETCTSGAGSLLLEFGVLSRLIDDPTYEQLARRVNDAIWQRRHNKTGLVGNVINIQTGEWEGLMSGLGAGIDSFIEYLLKTSILFGDSPDRFTETYHHLKKHIRRGGPTCRSNSTLNESPFYANVDMKDGTLLNTWIDSLMASFPAVQVLEGDLDEAICLHAFYYALWLKYDVLPERYNWHTKEPDVPFYPLRPEFAESTYALYQATRSPFYHHVGIAIIDSLNINTRLPCGFATMHSVNDDSLEDRMESFFLAETVKYLYLLFDLDNPTNKNYERLLFSTEGHMFPIPITNQFGGANASSSSCNYYPTNRLKPPLDEARLKQYFTLVDYCEDCEE